jgi:uncharacterized protein DUF1566
LFEEETMGLLSRTKTTEPAEAKEDAVSTRKTIVLNFDGRASEAVEAIAAATLEAGGFDAASAAPKPAEPPKIGDRMPDGTIYAGTSPDTGKPMYAAPADAPQPMKWQEAMDYAAKLDAHAHRDWRLPTTGELAALFNNRAAIGGFDVSGSNPAGWYWSASSDNEWGAWERRFSDGFQVSDSKEGVSALRCVR